jgi:hypothetical protein
MRESNEVRTGIVSHLQLMDRIRLIRTMLKSCNMS